MCGEETSENLVLLEEKRKGRVGQGPTQFNKHWEQIKPHVGFRACEDESGSSSDQYIGGENGKWGQYSGELVYQDMRKEQERTRKDWGEFTAYGAIHLDWGQILESKV